MKITSSLSEDDSEDHSECDFNDDADDHLPDPALCMYRDHDSEGGRSVWMPASSVDSVSGPSGKLVSAAQATHTASVAWSWIQLFVQCKYNSQGQPFGKSPFLLAGKEPKDLRAHMSTHVSEILLHQHRIFLYSVLIVKTEVRFMRWDRAGVLVSSPFDLKKSPEILLTFMYRFATAQAPSYRGYDPTAVFASEADVALLKALSPTNEHARKMFTSVIEDTEQYPIYRVCDTMITSVLLAHICSARYPA